MFSNDFWYNRVFIYLNRFTVTQELYFLWLIPSIVHHVLAQRFVNLCFLFATSLFENSLHVLTIITGFCERVCCDWRWCWFRKSFSISCRSWIPYWLGKEQVPFSKIFIKRIFFYNATNVTQLSCYYNFNLVNGNFVIMFFTLTRTEVLIFFLIC